MGDRKNFSDRLYSDNNQRAINAVTLLLTNRGWKVTSVEDYHADLIATMGNITMYHEVEIKNVWRGKFQWSTIQIPERKVRLLDHYNDDIIFWVISQDVSAAWAIDGLIVRHSPLVEVPNRYVSSGEKFFQVPTDKALLVNLEGGAI